MGNMDKPGPGNYSASFNETVPESLRELTSIYRACEAEHQVVFLVSQGKKHEMDNAALGEFLK